MFSMIDDFIGRLKVPFEDVFTTVFTVKTPKGTALIDTATYPSDVDDHIVPALKAAGITEDSLKYIILTHSHRDHAGGLSRLHELYPDAVIVSKNQKLQSEYPNAKFIDPSDGEEIMDVLRIVTVMGHSKDAVAILDTRTKSMITGDSLQLYGLFGSGKWGANIRFQNEHLKELNKLRGMDIEHIFASHEYDSLGWRADGREAVRAYIDECEKALDDILGFLGAYQQLTDEIIAEMYNSSSKRPTVGTAVFTAARARL